MTMPMPPTYFPSPPQGVWHLGPLPIRAYALFIITGIVVALLIGDRRWEARGGRRGVIYDIALWAVPFGLIGGRLYHLATDWRTYWGPGGAGFGAALRIWDGGLGIWGAVALGGVGAWIGCRRRGIPLPAFGDAIAPGIILAQAIGRLGNYFNQELYGRETTLPWGLEIFYRRDPSGYVDPHSLDGVSTGQVALVVEPTFLYELIWNVLVFVVLIYVDRRFTLGYGRLFALYVAGYCIGRFGVELLRDDTATHIAGIRINSFTSTFVFIGAVVYFISAPKGREDPTSLRGNDGDVEVSPVTEAAATAAALAAADKGDEPAAAGDTVASSEVADAQAAEPETAKTEAFDTGASEPESAAEAMEPDAVEPELDEAREGPESAEPEPAEPEAAEPEAAEPKAAEPKAAEPGSEPEAAESESAAEAMEPDAAEPEFDAGAGAPEPVDTEPEVAEPEAAEPEVEKPTPDSATTESEVDKPETTKPDGDAPAPEPDTEGEDTAGETEADTAGPGADSDNSADESSTGADEKATRRRWSLRRRNRR